METKEHFDKLLLKGKLEKVFKEALSYSRKIGDDKVYDDLLILNSRWVRNRNNQMKGILSFQQYNIEENQILNSLQTYIKEMFN